VWQISLCSSGSISLSLTENLKVEPTPSYDLTFIFPPMASQMRLHIVRPKPVPALFRPWDDFRTPKCWNRRGKLEALIPIPVSTTEICRNWGKSPLSEDYRFSSASLAPGCCLTLTTIEMVPFWVNLSAFETKLMSTCLILFLSDLTNSGTEFVIT